jgi:hypothetical protein
MSTCLTTIALRSGHHRSRVRLVPNRSPILCSRRHQQEVVAHILSPIARALPENHHLPHQVIGFPTQHLIAVKTSTTNKAVAHTPVHLTRLLAVAETSFQMMGLLHNTMPPTASLMATIILHLLVRQQRILLQSRRPTQLFRQASASRTAQTTTEIHGDQKPRTVLLMDLYTLHHQRTLPRGNFNPNNKPRFPRNIKLRHPRSRRTTSWTKSL